jgi:ABC-type transporter Mla subunit MlaD
MNLSNQQQIRLLRLNETVMANNEEHRSTNQQIQEQLKNLTQIYDDLNEKYVNKVNKLYFIYF